MKTTRLTKPVRRAATVPYTHGIKPELVVTLYPGGVLGIREQRRPARTEVKVAIATIYQRALWARTPVRRSRRRAAHLRRA